MPAFSHVAAAGEGGLDLTSGNRTLVAVVLVIALVALAAAVMFRRQVLAAGEGTENMRTIAAAVQEGAAAYLRRQFTTLGAFVVLVFLLLFLLPGDAGIRVGRSVFFVVGALFSATIGYLGMWLAVRANVRVAAAAREAGRGRDEGMRVAFRTGGIFTKAADVGADLVGKVEKNIPEDDPRNAATIADNVGDNVGDCAGMAADLFESYAVTLVAALILGTAAFGRQGLLFPLIVPAIGVLTAVIGVYITRARPGEGGLKAINRSFYISAVISAVLCVIAAFVYLPSSFGALVNPGDAGVVRDMGGANPQVIASAAVLIGI